MYLTSSSRSKWQQENIKGWFDKTVPAEEGKSDRKGLSAVSEVKYLDKLLTGNDEDVTGKWQSSKIRDCLLYTSRCV